MRTRQLGTAALLVLGAFVASCSPTEPQPEQAPPESIRGTLPLQPTVSVKELMGGLIDPASDFIFLAAGSEVTETGVREFKPETDEDWARVQLGALVMTEGSQLLRLHRPWEPEGYTDPNRETLGLLSPEQMEAKVNEDPVLWDAKVQALENVGREVLDIVKKKDAEALFNAGEDLDHACEDCHLVYWYPNELKFLDGIDRKLDELYGNGRKQTPPR